jgi:GT2 family glycosyltransferase
MIDITIVIPAYKPTSLLKSCLDSLIEYTDLTKTKVIVVCNGSERDSVDYIFSLNNPSIRFVWSQEALGFTKAANIGLKMVDTPYLILLNTDVVLLPQEKHSWVNRMIQPLKDNPNLAITGIAQVWLNSRPFFPFFNVGLKKELVEKFGYLDEIFSPGYGEDIDLQWKMENAGYESLMVTTTMHIENKLNINDFPLYHASGGSFGRDSEALLNRAYGIIINRYFKS